MRLWSSNVIFSVAVCVSVSFKYLFYLAKYRIYLVITNKAADFCATFTISVQATQYKLLLQKYVRKHFGVT